MLIVSAKSDIVNDEVASQFTGSKRKISVLLCPLETWWLWCIKASRLQFMRKNPGIRWPCVEECFDFLWWVSNVYITKVLYISLVLLWQVCEKLLWLLHVYLFKLNHMVGINLNCSMIFNWTLLGSNGWSFIKAWKINVQMPLSILQLNGISITSNISIFLTHTCFGSLILCQILWRFESYRPWAFNESSC